MVAASISAMSYFIPILAFLLVFIIVYALLFKTEVLGGNQPIMLFVSFILASFFIVEASLIEFVQFSSAWFSVITICVFFVLVLIAFLPGDNPAADFLMKNSWFAWVVLGAIFAVFIISAAYVFNWVVNWGEVRVWFNSDWFGLVLILIVAAIVSWRIVPKAA